MGSVGFTSGVHTWEARVVKTTKAGNVFFGVALDGADLR